MRAEPAVAERIARVEVELYPVDAIGGAPEQTQYFVVTHGPPASLKERLGAVRFPFSFGVAKANEDEVELVLRGLQAEDTTLGSIERKVVARFEPGVTRQVDIVLSDMCLGLDHVCVALDVTCSPADGTCMQVASRERIDSGAPEMDASAAEMDASVPMMKPGMRDAGSKPDTRPTADASKPPAIRDAMPDDDAAADDDDAGLKPRGCQVHDVCPAAYPCVESRDGGYTCQGQMADWLMPDLTPGAKATPSYDYTTTTGVVADRVTGLIWQRNIPTTYPGCSGNNATPGDTCTWTESKQYCSQLTLAGADDWRLPSKIELESLFGDTKNIPAIDFNAFPDVSGGHVFWTASPVVDPTDAAWTVRSGFAMTLPEVQSMQRWVRCVRGGSRPAGTPNERYQMHDAPQSVTDTRTQLTWQRDYADSETLDAANSYCANLGNGWRLPGVKELLTLVDPARFEPAIDPIFPALPLGGWFWTATPFVPLTAEQQTVVDFTGGMASGDDLVRQTQGIARATFHTRCVR